MKVKTSPFLWLVVGLCLASERADAQRFFDFQSFLDRISEFFQPREPGVPTLGPFSAPIAAPTSTSASPSEPTGTLTSKPTFAPTSKQTGAPTSKPTTEQRDDSDPTAGLLGSWAPVEQLEIDPTAAATLPDGKILAWSAALKTDVDNIQLKGETFTILYDPDTGISTTKLISDTNHDMFCPGTSHLNDLILVSGGTSQKKTSFYRPSTATWESGPEMNIGRGYHSQTVLADGTVFTLGGSWKLINRGEGTGGKIGEIWNPTTNEWTVVPGVLGDDTFLTNDIEGVFRSDNHYWLYPAPNGRLYHAGPSTQTHWIDLAGEGSVEASTVRPQTDRMCGTIVMYDIGKLLAFGGAESYSAGATPARTETFEYDISSNDVKIQQVGSMNFARTHANAVVAPNGNVFVFGGASINTISTDDNAVLKTEMYDQNTKTWTVLADNAIPRNYHSACVLMKDARVWCGGGNSDGELNEATHTDFEIYSPPYLFGGDRPQLIVIGGEGSDYQPGDTISVIANEPCTFALMRLGAATHALNLDSRRIPLESTPGQLLKTNYQVALNGNPSISLPGPYHLFATSIATGVPSVGATIYIKTI